MPYEVTRRFERALCEYTGAPFACAVNSCTAALMLAVRWYVVNRMLPVPPVVCIPKRTYVSVPCAILHAGATPVFSEDDWNGAYQLIPLLVWDSACRFTYGMYRHGEFQCVSFAARKILGAEQGGAILHDNAEADNWFRKMRFDGRTEGLAVANDSIDVIGHHAIMLPSVAATLLVRLHHLPKHNDDLSGASEYPDISQHPAFR